MQIPFDGKLWRKNKTWLCNSNSAFFWNLGRIKATEKQQRDDANFGEADLRC
jgi:hypothetical protein